MILKDKYAKSVKVLILRVSDFIVNLKGGPILGPFLHKILGEMLLMNSLDVSTLFVNQNMSYL